MNKNRLLLHLPQSGIFALLVCLAICMCTGCSQNGQESLREINTITMPDEGLPIAIVGAYLIDGKGGEPLPDAVVIIEGNRIKAVGPRNQVKIPENAEQVNAEGYTLMPGLVDAHFHSANDNELLYQILENGTTSLRDPGHPFRYYQSVDFVRKPVSRIFLTGAHLDGYPPVWVQQGVIVRDKEHARQTVYSHVENGGTAIKIMFVLPLEYYETIVDAANEKGVPVVAHLELVDADDAIRAGVHAIEHVSSFGTAIADPLFAQDFREAVREEYRNRNDGRYRLWSTIDTESDRVREVIELAAEHNIIFTPTLAAFEVQEGDDGVEDFMLDGFQNMVRFVEKAHQAGLQIAVASHKSVPYAERGWAIQREMELLAGLGMSPMDVIVGSTFDNARFFRSEQRIGSIEPDKLADLLLIDGNPLEDISLMHNIHRVMLNGQWVERER